MLSAMPDPTHKPPRERSQLLFGVVLLLIGAVLLADNLGFYIPLEFWKLWPIPLMAFGLLGLALPSRHLDRRGGMWLFAVGLYGAFGTYDWFGLGWNAWPLFLIAAGVSIIFFERRPPPGDPPQVKHET
jgi:hypothetical protein